MSCMCSHRLFLPVVTISLWKRKGMVLVHDNNNSEIDFDNLASNLGREHYDSVNRQQLSEEIWREL
jgi:hypothetical protein